MNPLAGLLCWWFGHRSDDITFDRHHLYSCNRCGRRFPVESYAYYPKSTILWWTIINSAPIYWFRRMVRKLKGLPTDTPF